jgi:hypothetical protein
VNESEGVSRDERVVITLDFTDLWRSYSNVEVIVEGSSSNDFRNVRAAGNIALQKMGMQIKGGTKY